MKLSPFALTLILTLLGLLSLSPLPVAVSSVSRNAVSTVAPPPPAMPRTDMASCARDSAASSCRSAARYGETNSGIACAQRSGTSSPSAVAQMTISLGDATINDDPANIATLSLWQSSFCYFAFASASANATTSKALGLLSLTIGISVQPEKGQISTLQTTISGSEQIQTPMLHNPQGNISACITVSYTGERTYHTCIGSPAEPVVQV